MSVLSGPGLRLVATLTRPRLRAVVGQGPAGRQGERGGQGERGPPGADARVETFEFNQSQPAAVWTIAHGLGRFPSVVLVDSAGDEFVAGKRYQDENTVIITLSAPVSGKAFLN